MGFRLRVENIQLGPQIQATPLQLWSHVTLFVEITSVTLPLQRGEPLVCSVMNQLLQDPATPKLDS